MNYKKVINPILLTIAALIWGAAFVAQDIASATVKPFGVINILTLLINFRKSIAFISMFCYNNF